MYETRSVPKWGWRFQLDMPRLRVSQILQPYPYRNHKFQHLMKRSDWPRVFWSRFWGTFKDAKRISERFKKHLTIQNPQSEELLVYNATADMDSDYRRLHLKMRQLALKRQKETSSRKKAAWALYEKKRFEGMIEEVTSFTNQLVDLFPAAQDDQRALCIADVSVINRSQDLALLQNAIGKGDQMFTNEVKKELEKRGHVVADWKADGSSKMWIGDRNASGVNGNSHHAARFTVSDHADIHIGNFNEGK